MPGFGWGLLMGVVAGIVVGVGLVMLVGCLVAAAEADEANDGLLAAMRSGSERSAN